MPAHIFDFGGFDDAPATQPMVRERTPSRPPAPATIDPTPKADPVKPSSPAPPITLPPATVDVPSAPALLPVPTTAEIATAAAKVRQASSQLISGTPDRAARRNAALRLLTSQDDSLSVPDRYAQTSIAIEQAVASGDVTLASQIADALVRQFAVDELSVRSNLLLDLQTKTATVNDAHALATAALPLIEAAVRENDFDLAEKLTKAAEAAAVRATARDSVLPGRVRSVAAEMRTARAQYATAKPAMDALLAGTATPAARTIAGKFMCFTKGDWDRGLPVLAACDDPRLKDAAQRDLAQPTDLVECQAVADQWWAISTLEPAVTRGAVMNRAAHWYRQILPQLDPQASVNPQTRITLAIAATRKLEPGLIAEIFHDPGLRLRQRIQIDPDIAAEFKTTSDLNVDPDIFGIRWTGMIKVPKAGNYTLSVKVKESIRIWIDGVLVLRADNPSNAVTADVMLVEGLHDLRIHYNSRGTGSQVRLSWSAAGLFKDQIIGPQYFFHDARAGGEYVAGPPLLPDYLDRTQRIGGLGGGFYDDVAADALGTLAGFEVRTGGYAGNTIIKSLTPIFQDSIGQQTPGRTFGQSRSDVISAVAKPGYAVSAITGKGGDRLDGFKVHFARLNPNGTLNLADTYESEWLGGTGGGKEVFLGGDGRPVVGICGRCGSDIDSVGLILRGRLLLNPGTIVSARWGTGDKWVDVTGRLRTMIRDGKGLTATPPAFGVDPAPGRRKSLEIIYVDKGVKKSVMIEENNTIAIPGLISR